MNKLYYEMSSAEQEYARIEHDLEWATCRMIEGISIAASPMRMQMDEYNKLCASTSDLLETALNNIKRLRVAVEDRFDEQIPDENELLNGGYDLDPDEIFNTEELPDIEGFEDDEESDISICMNEITREEAAHILRGMVLYDIHGAFNEQQEEIGTSYMFRTNTNEELSRFRTMIVHKGGSVRLSEEY